MKIKVYGKPDCPGCKSLIAKLEAIKQEYSYIDITKDLDAANTLIENGFRSVPVVEWCYSFLTAEQYFKDILNAK